ncbi:unnamed protein product [Trichobilharzia szidati]|nr:unnamed protein product [Trichobilharzia szidati]
MFSSKFSYISAITLLVFAAAYEGESTTIEDIEKLLSKCKDELPGLAQSIIDTEAEVKQLRDKIYNETAGTVKDKVDIYVDCWRQYGENRMGEGVFRDVYQGIIYESEKYGPYTEEYALVECVQEENTAYEAKLKLSETFDCDSYKPSIEEKDPENLKYYDEYDTLKDIIMDSYYQKFLYGKTILMKKIHETAIKRLKHGGGSN